MRAHHLDRSDFSKKCIDDAGSSGVVTNAQFDRAVMALPRRDDAA
jgi:hypothetical protein